MPSASTTRAPLPTIPASAPVPLDGRPGTFNFAHVASTSGTDRSGEFFTIVPGSGTGELAGITGGGALVVDADGTHRMRFDYSLD